MNSPYTSPFETSRTPTLPRNYSDTFDPKEYECKDSLELESYARNLHNYLMTLLPQTPFPAFLFEKLEKRLDGITSILQKRSAAKGVLNKDQAKLRLQKLGARLDATAPRIVFNKDEIGEPLDVTEPPPKKRRIEVPEFVKEIQREEAALKLLKRSYSGSLSQKERFNESQAEEEETPNQHLP